MGTYALRVPAFRVGYVPEAQGGLPSGPHVLYVPGTRTAGVPYVRVPWHPRQKQLEWLTASERLPFTMLSLLSFVVAFRECTGGNRLWAYVFGLAHLFAFVLDVGSDLP